jgi:DNA invertase Pin-like site-specific DNA recombinase
MPDANRLTIHIIAAVAEAVGRTISENTKTALAAAKSRGVKLGNPNGARALRGKQVGNADAVAKIKENAAQRARRTSRTSWMTSGAQVSLRCAGLARSCMREASGLPVETRGIRLRCHAC